MKDLLLITHFIGLAMAVGTGFAMTTLGIVVKELQPPDRAKYMLRAFILAKLGFAGLFLLIFSGLLMLFPLWQTLSTQPLLHLKLTLVLLQTIGGSYLMFLMRRAKKEQGGPVMSSIAIFGRILFINGVLIVIVAVLLFH